MQVAVRAALVAQLDLRERQQVAFRERQEPRDRMPLERAKAAVRPAQVPSTSFR